MIIFGILYLQDRGENARNNEQDRQDRIVTIARTQYIEDILTYQQMRYERTDCLRGVAFRNDIRANWVTLSSALEEQFGEQVVTLVALIRETVEKNTPKLDNSVCPPEPRKPAIPPILLVERQDGD